MKRAEKVIISCAVTGSIHTPSMSDALPVTARQIADQAVGAAGAGAAILHPHARDPDTGHGAFQRIPARDPRPLRRRHQHHHRLRAGDDHGPAARRRDLGATGNRLDEHGVAQLQHFRRGRKKISEFRHDWEPEYLAMTKDLILSNTFAQIDAAMRRLNDFGTRFGYERHDVGHLCNLAHFADRGLAEPPFFVRAIFGILGGIGPEPENLMHMKATADRLFGTDDDLSILGGAERVGLEDSLFIGKGRMALSNAEQVAKIRRILEELSLPIATPDEARAMLRTKGAKHVAF